MLSKRKASYLDRGIVLLVITFAASSVGSAPQSPILQQSVETRGALREIRATQGDRVHTPHDDRAQSVLTQHNDNLRSGAYLEETYLTTANVRPGGFGKLFSRRVDGQIYAQPLYVPHVTFSDQTSHNAIYIATMHNMVYAFDADDPSPTAGQPLWSVSLGNPLPYNFMRMNFAMLGANYNIKPEIGITSTPVIDYEKRTIYLVAKVCEEDTSQDCIGSTKINYWLHALDITSGKERENSPALIKPTCKGTGASSANGTITFDPLHHLQRPGLLLANGNVYMAFASHQDTRPYHGWVVAYNADTLKQSAVFCTTPDGKDGGIWQAGNGLAADSAGNVFAMVGNGTPPQANDARNVGNSFIKLSPSLALLDWFTPVNVNCLNKNDIDLGSAGPLLLPVANLLVGGGKEGVLYLLDTTNLGHFQARDSKSYRDLAPCAHAGDSDLPPPLQAFQAAPRWSPALIPVFGYHHIHGSPVFWKSPSKDLVIYTWAERDYLRAFRLDANTLRFSDTAPPGKDPQSSYLSAMTDSMKGMPGGMLSISANWQDGTVDSPANRDETGIVWASLPLKDDAFTHSVEGVLRAFKASDLTELWNSTERLEDRVGLFAKYCPPTVANGKVYLATFSNRLDVYGLLPSPAGTASTGATEVAGGPPAASLPRKN